MYLRLVEGSVKGGRLGSMLKDVFSSLILAAVWNATWLAPKLPALRPLFDFHDHPGIACPAGEQWRTMSIATSHFGFWRYEDALSVANEGRRGAVCVSLPIPYRFALPEQAAKWEAQGMLLNGTVQSAVERMRAALNMAETTETRGLVHVRRGDRAELFRTVTPAPLVISMLHLAESIVGNAALVCENKDVHDLIESDIAITFSSIKVDFLRLVQAPLLIHVNAGSAFSSMAALLRKGPTVVIGSCVDPIVGCDLIWPRRGDERIVTHKVETHINDTPPRDLNGQWHRNHAPHPLAAHPRFCKSFVASECAAPQFYPERPAHAAMAHLWLLAQSTDALIFEMERRRSRPRSKYALL